MFDLEYAEEMEHDALSSMKNPFLSDKIESIRFYIYPRSRYNPEEWSATIEFKNGNTSGEHKFTGKDFSVLVKEVQNFIKAL